MSQPAGHDDREPAKNEPLSSSNQARGDATGEARKDAPTSAEEPAEEPLAEEVSADRALLAKAIGGWRGVIDSGLPSIVFIIAYLIGNQLNVAIWLAVGTGVGIAVFRLARRQSIQQILGGLAGVAISAYFASRTGKAENYFLPGLLTNLGYFVAILVSILVRWPLLGLFVGSLVGEPTAWRHDPAQRRAYAAASWIWVGVFGLRLLVQVPLYLAGAVGVLGFTKVAMGWPLFLLGAYLTYRVLHPVVGHRMGSAMASPKARPTGGSKGASPSGSTNASSNSADPQLPSRDSSADS